MMPPYSQKKLREGGSGFSAVFHTLKKLPLIVRYLDKNKNCAYNK